MTVDLIDGEVTQPMIETFKPQFNPFLVCFVAVYPLTSVVSIMKIVPVLTI